MHPSYVVWSAGRPFNERRPPRGRASGHRSIPRLGRQGYGQVQNQCKPARGDYGVSPQSLSSKGFGGSAVQVTQVQDLNRSLSD